VWISVLNLDYAFICTKFIICIAEMEEVYLISPDVDQNHRANILQQRRLEPLVTRGPRENWRIHPAWEERYVFNLLVRVIYYLY